MNNMNIIDFYTDGRQDFWKLRIAESGWGAADFLVSLIEKGEFYGTLGNDSHLYLLTAGDFLVSYAAYARRDCIKDDSLFPWIGFVFTFPQWRGQRNAFTLFDYIFQKARQDGVRKIYIATDHDSLYEKYGFSYVESRTDVWGDECRIYAKNVISLPEINTPRLKLRMLDGSDFEAVFKWGSAPLVNRFMLYPLYKNA